MTNLTTTTLLGRSAPSAPDGAPTSASLLARPVARPVAPAVVPGALPGATPASRVRAGAALRDTLLVHAGGIAFGLMTGMVVAAVGLRLGPVAVVAAVALVLLVAPAWRSPHLVVMAAVLALPAGQVELGPVELVQLVFAVASLAVLGPAVLRRELRLPPWPVAAPLAAFLLIAAIATPRAQVADLAFRLDVQLVLLVLVTAAVSTAVCTSAQARAVVVALVVAGGLVSVRALLDSGPTEAFYGGGVIAGRALGIFAQPNELGLFSAVLLVVAVGVALTADRTRIRVLCLVCAGLLLAALGLSLSRGAWLGAVVGLVVLAVLVPAVRRRLAAVGALALVVLVGMGVLGVGPVSEITVRLASVSDLTDNPYDQRPLIWAEGLRLIQDSPVLGQGPGGFTVASSSDALRTGAFLDVEHAHNLALNVAVEYGLLGLFALLALVTGLAALLRRRRDGSVDALPRILAAGLAAVLAHGLLDYPLRNPTTLTTVWLLLSLLAAAAAAGRRIPATRGTLLD